MNKRKIQVINLTERSDRWDYMKKTFSYLNIERFNAIKHKNPWKGCSLSHISIIEKSKKRNDNYIIIMEDDVSLFSEVKFIKYFNKIITFLEDNMDKWDIFQFGTTYSNEGSNTNVHIINKELNIIEYQYGKTASFIIYNKTIYDKIIESKNDLLNESQNTIDITINKFNFRQWTILPFLSYQIDGYSNIRNKVISYKNIFIKNQTYLEKKIKQ